MRLFLSSLLLSLLCVGPDSAFAHKVIVLDTGDTLLGDIVERDEESCSIQLSTGTLITLPAARVVAVEEPKASEEEVVSIPPPSAATKEGNLNLRNVFQVIDPTPTPLPLVPLDLELDYTMRKRRQRKPVTDALSLFEKPAPPPRVAMEPLSDIQEEYGEVVWNQGLSKFRTETESWKPALTGELLHTENELATLSGKVIIHLNAGGTLRLNPSSQVKFHSRAVDLLHGKGWLDTRGLPTYSFRFAGMEAVIENGLASGEYLGNGGARFHLLEGNAALIMRPEGTVIRGELVGPVALLLDANRDVVEQTDLPQSATKDWEAWQMIDKSLPEPGEPLADPGLGTDSLGLEGKRLIQIANLQALAEAVTDFYLDQGTFPPEKRPFFQDLIVDPGNGPGWKGPYLNGASLPLMDEWGSELHYRIKTDPLSGESTAEVFSLGPNKTLEEGSGDDLGVLIERPGR